MLSALVLASFAFAQQSMAWQIVPGSQFPFDRKQALLESGVHDLTGAFLVNDNAVSDKAYEAIVNNPDCVKIVKLIRKDAAGLTAWTWSGKPLPAPTEVDMKEVADYELGEVGMILEFSQLVTYANSASDKPGVALNLGTSRKSTFIPGPKYAQMLQKVGKPTGKFANIRFSIRVSQLVASLPKDMGATKTLDDVTFRVAGPMADTNDKFEHLEVVQQGLPILGSFALVPGIDWDLYAKDRPAAKTQRQAQSGGRIIKPANGTQPEGETRYDIRSNIPIKYWTGLNVHRNSTVQGYFGHIAMEPTK